VEHRFCHPDACRAQILRYNESSRYMEKLCRERERGKNENGIFIVLGKNQSKSQNQKGFLFLFLVEFMCMPAFEIWGGMLSFNCVY
jgi:hypothetical protein